MNTPTLSRSPAAPQADDAPDDFATLGRIDVHAMPRVLARLVRLAWRYPGRCFAAVLCAIGATLFNLITPKLLGDAVDQAHHLLGSAAPGASADAARSGLWWIAGLIVAACAARGALTGLQGYLGENIAQRVGYDLRLAFYEKLQRLDFSFHDRRHSGDLIARGMLDLEGVRAFLESGLLRTLSLALLVGAGAWRLMHVDLLLGALALSFVPFVVWRAARMGVMLRLSWERLQQLMSDLTRGMEENLQGARVVRAFASRLFELAKFDRVSEAALRLSNKRITLRMGSVSTMNFSFYLAMALVLWFGGRRIAAGQLTVGLLTECLTFMTLLQQPVRQIGMIVNASARAASSGSRFFEILDTAPAIHDRPGARPLVLTNGVLRFEHVFFAYPPTPGHPGPSRGAVLEDISFELRPGRTLGIVGAPGSGKSTLAQLIARFYDVDAGRVTIDDQDVRDVTLDSLRQAVSLVQQETFLFDTSIHHNAAYAEPEIEEDRVVASTTVAQLHDHVAQLPEGYGTRVGERGVALSGGQRQRLSIARGLTADPAIIVLDDATSAVDASTEQHLRTTLHAAVRHKSTVVIAHRLSSLMHADEILVLEEGRITERGTHDALLARGGHYAALWKLQNRGGGAHAHAAATEGAPA
jgi:ATP-binding cassette subfamily B multidrug efflux pump